MSKMNILKPKIMTIIAGRLWMYDISVTKQASISSNICKDKNIRSVWAISPKKDAELQSNRKFS